MNSLLQRSYHWCIAPVTARPQQWEYYRLLLIVFLIDILLSAVSVTFFASLDMLEEVEEIGVDIISWSFLVMLILISVIEELVFRIVPLVAVMRVSHQPSLYLATAFTAAVVFGYVHGGVEHIFIQGLGGFLYGVIFIKYAAGGSRLVEASLVVITLHTAFNALIGLILLMSGETTF